jgi:leader peptidase (prepilin peptidase) / N-methyltransferase
VSEALGWALFGALAGLIAGSFLATLIMRWPRGEGLGGRSHCDACEKQLGVRDLVPILSFLFSKGRCRTCGATIDYRHVAIEFAAMLIGAIAFFVAPGWSGAGGALFGWLLLTLAALDVEHFWLPDALTGTLAATGLAFALLDNDLAARLIGAAAGFGSLALIAWGYRTLRKRDGMGAGDPKLLGAIGLWLGWEPLPFVLLGASLTGLLAVLTMRLRGGSIDGATKMPLGALLAIAAFPVWVVLRG